MILIAGDSWGIGEWQDGAIVHNGLAQYLADYGYTVVNLSVPGAGNQAAVRNLERFLMVNHHIVDSVQAVFYFQTEWTRDSIPNEDITNSKNFDDLESQWTNKCYYELALTRKKHNLNCAFCVVGGTSDAVEFGAAHNNVKIICASLTEMLLDQELERVYSWWAYRTEDLVANIKKLRPDMLQDLVNSIQKGHNRQSLCDNYPEWFYPDGAHANRHAHKKLFDKIMELNIIPPQVASASSHYKHSAAIKLTHQEARDGY